ncbi:sodium:calcium antiporter [Aspergillus lucknowensis]|uniref:Sodium/calcium exchanger membrane region domain-containing protein n=1 Tax=Aspergillus lucknowensis TaxID=176173 RepID=A0ABR4LZ05_9EURO
MQREELLFNIASFIAGVFMLDYGADRFVDHTAIVAQRLGVSQTLVALLTAGAEYEELAVVIAAVLQKQSALAIGNVMGSTISNILGAFSLGLLLHPGHVVFDRSAQVYTALLLLVTTAFCILACFGTLNATAGGILVAAFVVYMLSIFVAIHKGVVTPPQASDSDSDSDEGMSDDEHPNPSGRQTGLPETEASPLLSRDISRHQRRPRPLAYHVSQLIIGLAALTLSGYILSHSASAIAEYLNLSATVIGFTVVSFATTLPEKMIALMSGARGHSGIIVATTAGSNIFLLTLCSGVVGLAQIPADQNNHDQVQLFEVVFTWVSSFMLFLVVLLGANRIIGAVFLVMYLVFLVLEFTIFRR